MVLHLLNETYTEMCKLKMFKNVANIYAQIAMDDCFHLISKSIEVACIDHTLLVQQILVFLQ